MKSKKVLLKYLKRLLNILMNKICFTLIFTDIISVIFEFFYLAVVIEFKKMQANN